MIRESAEEKMPKRSIENMSRGFVLLEALIAIAIFSFALLGLVGMQALSIKNSADAKYRADAAYLANQIIAQMWVDRSNLASYAFRPTDTACSASTTVPAYAPVNNWLTDMEAVLPGVNDDVTSSQKPKIVIDATGITSTTVTVTICWRLPNDPSPHNHIATAKISA
jgi:type IV pilus assembly protein PilV